MVCHLHERLLGADFIHQYVLSRSINSASIQPSGNDALSQAPAIGSATQKQLNALLARQEELRARGQPSAKNVNESVSGLSRSISTRSGTLGFCETLDSLQEDFRHSAEHVRKITEMRDEFAAWRRVRGDGNCYYRALGCGFMEHLLSPAGRPRLQEFHDRLAALQGDAKSAVRFLKSFLDSITVDRQSFYKAI